MPEEREPPEIEAETRGLEVEGVVWEVCVEGRAFVRAGGGKPTPILQLVFRADDSPAREALVVGRSLDERSADELREAFRCAGLHTPGRRTRGFFDEIGRVGSG
ncbi:MAG: hypothetical protein RQ745_08435 [Longimicrobiales bacterium]|nr:hypothetical protein [Longimicrobiales bacterium]